MSEIRGYTLAQVHGFARAIHRAERERRRDALLDARAAQAPQKAFTEYLSYYDDT